MPGRSTTLDSSSGITNGDLYCPNCAGALRSTDRFLGMTCVRCGYQMNKLQHYHLVELHPHEGWPSKEWLAQLAKQR